MLLSAAINPQTLLSSNPNYSNSHRHHHHCNLLFCPKTNSNNTLQYTSPSSTTTTYTHHRYPPPPPPTLASSAFANGTSSEHSLHNPPVDSSIRHVSLNDDDDDEQPPHVLDSSASALASAIRKASTSPVEFTQRMMHPRKNKTTLVLPSTDFQTLCLQQLDLFRRIVNPDALLSVSYFLLLFIHLIIIIRLNT